MVKLSKVNQWISDHKILSGIAGVLIMGIVTFALANKPGANQSGTINFEDKTEITKSNLTGRDMHVKTEIAPNKNSNIVPIQ